MSIVLSLDCSKPSVVSNMYRISLVRHESTRRVQAGGKSVLYGTTFTTSWINHCRESMSLGHRTCGIEHRSLAARQEVVRTLQHSADPFVTTKSCVLRHNAIGH